MSNTFLKNYTNGVIGNTIANENSGAGYVDTTKYISGNTFAIAMSISIIISVTIGILIGIKIHKWWNSNNDDE